MITSKVRGPCTPSTRLSSMSLVALGPLIMVSRAAGRQPAESLRDIGDDLIGQHDAKVVVRNQRDHSPALINRAIQDQGAGLGDCDRAAGDDPIRGVEFGDRQLIGQLTRRRPEYPSASRQATMNRDQRAPRPYPRLVRSMQTRWFRQCHRQSSAGPARGSR